MIPTQELLNNAHSFAKQAYDKLPDGQKFFDFAIKLVKQCTVIGGQAGTPKQDILAAQIAALFLFTGKSPSADAPEEGGWGQAGEFLTRNQADNEFLAAVKECMVSVRPPQLPAAPAGQLLCDALNSLLLDKKEIKTRDIGLYIPGWEEGTEGSDTSERLAAHLEQLVFYTPYAKKNYEKSLRKRTAFLRKAKDQPEASEYDIGKPLKDVKTLDLLDQKPDRGAATLFRNASREHIAMLSIVHQKSGFLLSFNSILLSVVLSILSTKLNDYPHLLIPTVMLVVTCLGTIIFTILATKPMIIRNRKDPLARDTFNVMFFGHYVHLDWQEYSNQIKNVSNNVDNTVEVLSKNIYYQGVVLDKKYRLLLIAYKIFLYGLVVSVSAFLISFFQ